MYGGTFLMNTRTMTKCFGWVLFTIANNMYIRGFTKFGIKVA